MNILKVYEHPGIKATSLNQETWEFDYVNWRGDRHHYRVAVEGIEFGPYDPGGKSPDGTRAWVLHGACIRRDNVVRMARPRRTFVLEKIENLERSEP